MQVLKNVQREVLCRTNAGARSRLWGVLNCSITVNAMIPDESRGFGLRFTVFLKSGCSKSHISSFSWVLCVLCIDSILCIYLFFISVKIEIKLGSGCW